MPDVFTFFIRPGIVPSGAGRLCLPLKNSCINLDPVLLFLHEQSRKAVTEVPGKTNGFYL